MHRPDSETTDLDGLSFQAFSPLKVRSTTREDSGFMDSYRLHSRPTGSEENTRPAAPAAGPAEMSMGSPSSRRVDIRPIGSQDRK